MANATVIREWKDVVTTEQKHVREGVTLRLSNEEAIALRSLLAKVGGSPDHTARRYTDSVYKALRMADVPYTSALFEGGVRSYSGSIDVTADLVKGLEEK